MGIIIVFVEVNEMASHQTLTTFFIKAAAWLLTTMSFESRYIFYNDANMTLLNCWKGPSFLSLAAYVSVSNTLRVSLWKNKIPEVPHGIVSLCS